MTPESNMTARGVSLEPFTSGYVEKTFYWVCDPELKRLFLIRNAVTKEGHAEYFNRQLADHSQKIFAVFLINEHVGNCGIKNMESEGRSGEIWIYIGERKFRGKGVGRAATCLLIEKAFREYRLEHLYLHVADFNKTAIALYKRLGFAEAKDRERSRDWDNRGCRILRMEMEKSRWISG